MWWSLRVVLLGIAALPAMPSTLQLETSTSCTLGAEHGVAETRCSLAGQFPGSIYVQANAGLFPGMDLADLVARSFSEFFVGIQAGIEMVEMPLTGQPSLVKTASASTSLLLPLYTKGPPRPGIAVMYFVGGLFFDMSSERSANGAVSGSIGPYSPPLQSGRVRPIDTVVPFQLGVPFDVKLSAAISGSANVQVFAASSLAADLLLYEVAADGSRGAPVTIFVAPEPSTAAIAMAAVLLLAFARRHPRKRR